MKCRDHDRVNNENKYNNIDFKPNFKYSRGQTGKYLKGEVEEL